MIELRTGTTARWYRFGMRVWRRAGRAVRDSARMARVYLGAGRRRLGAPLRSSWSALRPARKG
jgi:hypothetical protein